jgi:serine/threonine protein kinase
MRMHTHAQRNFTLSKWEQLKIVMQICEGLRFMASKRYIHMDIAARNCLMDEGNAVKLADFGLTRQLDEGTNRCVGNGVVGGLRA